MADDEFELPTWAALPARPHAEFDALARTLAERLSTPLAFVVLVSKGGQVFPGAYGLPEAWNDHRSLPLSGSPSQLIARTGRPLVIRDVREDPMLRETSVLRELQVAAYAGTALPDSLGRPLGVLCALDVRPRNWSATELATLEALAAQASQELQRQSLELAERESRAACERAAAAAQHAARAAHEALEQAEAEADRARVVARLGTALLATETFGELLRAVDRFVRSPLGATSVVLGVAEAGTTPLTTYLMGPSTGLRGSAQADVDDRHPLAVAVREHRMVPVGSREEGDRLFPGVRLLSEPLPQSLLALPLLPGQHASAAALMLGWCAPREMDPALRTVVGDLADQLGHALDRVLLAAARQRLDRSLPAAVC